MDEPGNNLYPKNRKLLLDYFKEITSENTNLKLIFSSHNIEFVDVSNYFVLKAKTFDETNKIIIKTNYANINWQYEGFHKVLKSIFGFSDEKNEANLPILIVEGITDKIYLDLFLSDKYEIYNSEGFSNMLVYASYFLGRNSKILFILDSGEAETKYMKGTLSKYASENIRILQ